MIRETAVFAEGSGGLCLKMPVGPVAVLIVALAPLTPFANPVTYGSGDRACGSGGSTVGVVGFYTLTSDRVSVLFPDGLNATAPTHYTPVNPSRETLLCLVELLCGATVPAIGRMNVDINPHHRFTPGVLTAKIAPFAPLMQLLTTMTS